MVSSWSLIFPRQWMASSNGRKELRRLFGYDGTLHAVTASLKLSRTDLPCQLFEGLNGDGKISIFHKAKQPKSRIGFLWEGSVAVAILNPFRLRSEWPESDLSKEMLWGWAWWAWQFGTNLELTSNYDVVWEEKTSNIWSGITINCSCWMQGFSRFKDHECPNQASSTGTNNRRLLCIIIRVWRSLYGLREILWLLLSFRSLDREALILWISTVERRNSSSRKKKVCFLSFFLSNCFDITNIIWIYF